MRLAFLFGALFGALLLAPAPGRAADDANAAIELLRQMARAQHQLSYEGTFVYLHGGHMQTMRIIHQAGPGGERERLISLDGPSREVVRDGEKVICYIPDSHAVVVKRSASSATPMSLPEEPSALEPYYRITLEGNKRIAGRAAQKVTVAPADPYRYGRNFWVAADSGLMLQSELLDERGEVVERLVFTSLDVRETIPESALRPETAQEGLTWYRPGEGQETGGTHHWQVTEVPPGFSRDFSGNHYLPALERAVEHHVFSDGLASASVFVEPAQTAGDAQPGRANMGAVNAFSLLLDGHRVTAVGEVPMQTVELLARSVERQEKPAE